MNQSRQIVMALAGNPNSGKTTAFNRYTGARQHVGNYPGITVEKKDGIAHLHGQDIKIVDLPGTYSLTAYSQEEVVARRVLVEEQPDCVIDIVNSSALERNLYLVVQIMEMGLPVLVALNMMDEAHAQGIKINPERLSELLGVPVVPTVARSGQGLETALEQAAKLAELRRRHESRGMTFPHAPLDGKAIRQLHEEHGHVEEQHHEGARPGKFPCRLLNISYGPDLDPVLAEMAEKIEQASFLTKYYPARWIALKYLENDTDIRSQGRSVDAALSAQLEGLVKDCSEHLSKTFGTYPEAVIADYRYGFISSILRQGVLAVRDEAQERIAASDKADKVLTNRLLGPLIMLGVLYAIYKITFTLGEIPMGWLGDLFGWLGDLASAHMAEGLLKSLVVSGVIDGVGGVMGFVPLILIMFLLIAILEDSGYMARVAYMLDRVFRAFGLHGCSVMPFIVSGGIAGGCAVPGVMAARTLRSPREKLATLLTVPYMTCGAKLPVFLLLVGVFFPQHEAGTMFLISLVAWVVALLVALFLRSTLIKGPATPFVMELPPYRTPTLRGVLIHTWERTWQYIKKAGTVILAVSILLWAAMKFPALPADQAEVFESKRAAIEEQYKDEAAAPQAAVDAAEGESAAKPEATEGAAVAKSEASENESGEAAPSPKDEALAEVDNEEAAARLDYSMAGRIGQALEVVTAPAGFDWRTNIALVGGIAAKEVIVSTLGTAYSLGEVDAEDAAPLAERISQDPGWSKANAAALIVFVLLYAPCFVTVVVIARESGSWKWAGFSVVFNTLLAYAAAVAVYQAGRLMI